MRQRGLGLPTGVQALIRTNLEQARRDQAISNYAIVLSQLTTVLDAAQAYATQPLSTHTPPRWWEQFDEDYIFMITT